MWSGGQVKRGRYTPGLGRYEQGFDDPAATWVGDKRGGWGWGGRLRRKYTTLCHLCQSKVGVHKTTYILQKNTHKRRDVH